MQTLQRVVVERIVSNGQLTTLSSLYLLTSK